MIEYQRIILADKLRNSAFEQALKHVIRKGQSTVSDIGSGTGFLSFLASKLGAKACYLYEQSELLELSRTLAKANHIANCHFVQAHSAEVSSPPRTDIVLSETLGNIALEEGIVEIMNDAHRFLKPGGTMIPEQLRQFVAPVITDRVWREITSMDRIGFGLDFAAAREIAVNNVYVRTVRPPDLFDAGTEWDTIDFRKKKNRSVRLASVEWNGQRSLSIFGFALWWEALLTPGVSLSTSPAAPATHWEQVFLPLRTPLTLRKGDHVALQLTIDARPEIRINVTWRCVLTRGGKVVECQEMDMRKGDIG